MQYFTWSAVFGQATFSLFGLVTVAVLLGGYSWAYHRAVARGLAPSSLRATVFVLLGVLPLGFAVLSGLGTIRDVTMQAAAWQVGLLLAVAPAGVALGEPVRVLRAGLGSAGRLRLDRALSSRTARVLAFPIVTPLLSALVAFVFFFSGWFQATVASAALREVSYAVLFLVGLVFAVPLVGELDEAMPGWCTHPVRAFLAFLDGLLDSVPGLVLMLHGTSLWLPAIPVAGRDLLGDQQLAGATLLCVVEAVGVPFLIGVFVTWMRADATQAAQFDAAADAAEAADGGVPGAGGDGAAGGGQRPWWLDDPQFADRFRPPGS